VGHGAQVSTDAHQQRGQKRRGWRTARRPAHYMTVHSHTTCADDRGPSGYWYDGFGTVDPIILTHPRFGRLTQLSNQRYNRGRRCMCHKRRGCGTSQLPLLILSRLVRLLQFLGLRSVGAFPSFFMLLFYARWLSALLFLVKTLSLLDTDTPKRDTYRIDIFLLC
jgi:hypothetical protein